MSTDWNDYPHSTDESIASALHERVHGSKAGREDVDLLRDRFVSILRETHDASPDLMKQTSGASAFLTRLRAEGHGIAIATGGWTASARFKLRCCGIEHDSIPAAFACDAHPRADIIEIARARAVRQGEHSLNDPAVVYVGTVFGTSPRPVSLESVSSDLPAVSVSRFFGGRGRPGLPGFSRSDRFLQALHETSP